MSRRTVSSALALRVIRAIILLLFSMGVLSFGTVVATALFAKETLAFAIRWAAGI